MVAIAMSVSHRNSTSVLTEESLTTGAKSNCLAGYQCTCTEAARVEGNLRNRRLVDR